MTMQPFEKFEAVHAWHLQIGDDETRQWVTLPVGIFAFAAKIVHGLETTVYLNNRIAHSGPFKGETHQRQVIRRIVYQHDCSFVLHLKIIGYILAGDNRVRAKFRRFEQNSASWAENTDFSATADFKADSPTFFQSVRAKTVQKQRI